MFHVRWFFVSMLCIENPLKCAQSFDYSLHIFKLWAEISQFLHCCVPVWEGIWLFWLVANLVFSKPLTSGPDNVQSHTDVSWWVSDHIIIWLSAHLARLEEPGTANYCRVQEPEEEAIAHNTMRRAALTSAQCSVREPEPRVRKI